MTSQTFQHLPDETLLRLMAARDEDALSELHRRYARLLYALGNRMLHHSDDVDMCVQDAFMNAWKHAGRFDPARAKAKTWLVSIAHHRFLQQLRDRPSVALELEDWDAPTAARDPADALMAQQAVAGLAQSQRKLVELMYFGGYTHAELSTLTGLPLGTVKSRLRVALANMRMALNNKVQSGEGGESQ